MKKTRKKILVLGLMIVTALLTVWIKWDNERIVVSTFTVESERVPETFDGYRIVQVSDLHNDEFGEGNERLLAMVREAAPDMIAITGDFLDSRRTDAEKAMDFVEHAMEIAPCYYVTGNHEARTKEYAQLEKDMLEIGVIVLRDETILLEKDGAEITVAALDDPRFHIKTDNIEKTENVMRDELAQLMQEVDTEKFLLLLSHRPELFEVYCEQDVDLVLAGHLHGGQFRLPGVGGLIGPTQLFFPKYDAGLFVYGNTQMIVSRGLGQSVIPFRINNPPELVVVTLETKS